MGGVPIIGDAVEAVKDVVEDVGQATGIVKKKTTAQTRPAETAKETKPAAKKDIARVLRRGTRKIRRGNRSLVGGRLFPTPGAEATKDLSPIRNPRDGSTLGS
jgi:hypothetical protein